MRRIILIPIASMLACYSPAKEDLTNDTTTMSTSGEDTSSTGTTLTTTDTTVTSAEVTSTSNEESASESESTMTASTSTTAVDESSSSSGDLPDVCGDGLRNPDTEDCDDGNQDVGDLCDAECHFETLTFVYTGAPEMLEVPAWVDTLRIEAYGAQGGGSLCCEGEEDDGGLGGYVAGTLPTLGGVTLSINVGGIGASAGAGGWNGGGNAGMYGGSGGGGSDVRIGDTLDGRILVAGGGGGGNCGCPDHGSGGGGGGLEGEAGISLQGFTAPGGGTQDAGGTAGDMATAGALGVGGTGSGDVYHVAGGGGGYYGGGGGFATGAGGGSSYYGAATDPETMAAMQLGDGQILITPVASL